MIIKCKMCGGDLHPEENSTTCECEFCGTVQTIPSDDGEKKVNLFNRANRLRINAEFDKASAVYESIVAEFPEEAEAYWGLCLCAYGIEYVDDPVTGEKKPTCHRTVPVSIMEDSNFEQTCENADAIARRMYREEAKAIDQIQKDILSIVSNEDPYDVFICYKETAEEGGRTEDSVLAQDIYDSLTNKGLKVFFARITLENKLGQQYEPYIYAALSSAKVMLAIGTKYEYYDAVWVKNEWMRFLSMMKNDKRKTLIPCYKNLDAYDMPKEFKNLQAQDMGKLGWLQDLSRGVIKLCGKEMSKSPSTTDQSQTVNTLLKRVEVFIQDGEKERAAEYIDKALDLSPECSQAYFLKFLNKNGCNSIEQVVEQKIDYISDNDYKRAKALAKGKEKEKFVTFERSANASLFKKVGNIVRFGGIAKDETIRVTAWDKSNGRGEFDYKWGNSSVYKRMEWIVIKVEEGKSLLLLKNNIKYETFHDIGDNLIEPISYISWGDCSLRRWLNKEFYSTSFNMDEKKAIMSTTISADEETETPWKTKGLGLEVETQDRIYLLSYKEAWECLPDAESRLCYDESDPEMLDWWWLRTPGEKIGWKATVDDSGELDQLKYNEENAVRPVMWIDLNSAYFDRSHEDDWENEIAKSIKEKANKEKELEKQLLQEIAEREKANQDINAKKEALYDKASNMIFSAKTCEDYENAIGVLDELASIDTEYIDVADLKHTCEVSIEILKETDLLEKRKKAANIQIEELTQKYETEEKKYREFYVKKQKEETDRKTILAEVDKLQKEIDNDKNTLSNLHGLFVRKKKEALESRIQIASRKIAEEKRNLMEVESRLNSLLQEAPSKPNQSELVYHIAVVYHDNELDECAMTQLSKIRDYKECNQLLSTIQEEKKVKFSTVGSIVKFGHESIYDDEEEKTHDIPVEWIVLESHENKSMLLSRRILLSRPLNNQKEKTTWEQCDLREFLNKDVMDNYFTPEEQEAILTVDVDNSKKQGNEKYDTVGGNNTSDKIYLLSYHEAINKYFSTNEERICLRRYENESFSLGYWRAAIWWLRSPAAEQDMFWMVNHEGRAISWNVDSKLVWNDVRPVIWVDLDKITHMNACS